MSDQFVIVPSDGDGFVELARTKTGRLFRKHILNKGDLIHPVTKAKIKIDDTFVKTLKTNFDNGVCDIVQVPLANDRNEHTEDPTRNIGEVVSLEERDNKVYVVIDARDKTHADKLGKTYLGASAMLHLDYTDTRTGKKVGPTLLHACVTNRPYVTGLENYQEIVAATSDNTDEAAVLLSDDVVETLEPPAEETDMPDEKTTSETKPSLEELLTALKTEHNIDVPALQTQATAGETAAKLSQTLVDALTQAGAVKLSNDSKDEVTNETVVQAVAELAQSKVELSARVVQLEERDAKNAVDKLVEEGKIPPAKRAKYVELKLSNPAMFDALVPDEPIIKLSHEEGVTPPEDAAHKAHMDQEIARLSALANGK